MGDGMNQIQRKSGIGRFVWSGLAVLSLLLFMVARQQEQAALTKQVDEAQRRALLYANTVLYNALRAPTVSTPLTGATYRDLYTDIQGQMFTDTRVARVRLWATDGTLLFSTDERDKIGELRAEQDPSISAAAGGEVSSRLTTAPFTKATTGDPGTQTELFQTFVPLRVPDRIAVLGAVQIDQFYDSLRTAAAGPWKTAQAVLLVLTALFTVLAVLSFRRRPATSAASVPAENETDDAVSAEAVAAYAELEQRHEESLARLASSEAIAATTASELSGRADDLAHRNEELERAIERLNAELASATSSAGDIERAADERVEEATRLAAESEQRAEDLELKLTAAQRETEEVASEALESRTAPPLSAQALELLEARVIAAEDRAADAERRLAELGHDAVPALTNGHHAETNGHHVEDANGHHAQDHDEGAHVTEGSDQEPISPISAEANDLRARLARTAARKKRPTE